ncbi:hypothetical protein H6G00_00305 [Leptolyngbya sp. FACHB-541]|uniref:hypothetical protein n=1 Tax=Leptolyngbya sp. FACHB-541 TaxID=2692810 RepID=UPI001683D13D|nr:hypothetical protein [Leptolyngbya sp. FACHB-541]MBD1995070.1 hypothetical protein [Leptolyngbya sp. FACHB-541]
MGTKNERVPHTLKEAGSSNQPILATPNTISGNTISDNTNGIFITSVNITS